MTDALIVLAFAAAALGFLHWWCRPLSEDERQLQAAARRRDALARIHKDAA